MGLELGKLSGQVLVFCQKLFGLVVFLVLFALCLEDCCLERFDFVLSDLQFAESGIEALLEMLFL